MKGNDAASCGGHGAANLAINRMAAALKVIAFNRRIAGWLAENDPKALGQVRGAIAAAEEAGLLSREKEQR